MLRSGARRGRRPRTCTRSRTAATRAGWIPSTWRSRSAPRRRSTSTSTIRRRLRRTLLALSNRVAARLRQADVAGRTIAIKVRLSDFRTLNRSRTLQAPTDVGAGDLRHRDRTVRGACVRRPDPAARRPGRGPGDRGRLGPAAGARRARARLVRVASVPPTPPPPGSARAAVRPASLLGSDEAGHPARAIRRVDGAERGRTGSQTPGPWNSPTRR